DRGPQLVAADAGVLDEALLTDHVEGGAAGSRGDRVAAVRAALGTRPGRGHQLLRGGDRADREAGGDALRGDEDVGRDRGVLVAPEPAGPAATGLHLVDDEQDAEVVGPLAQSLEEGRRGGQVAAVAEGR